jgi:hypothetical protein
MKIGPLEIALIVAVVIVMALIARIARPGRLPVQGDKSPGHGARSKGLFRNTGIIMVVVGVIILGLAAGLFHWALQGYLWALVLIAGGTFMVLLARRKA